MAATFPDIWHHILGPLNFYKLITPLIDTSNKKINLLLGQDFASFLQTKFRYLKALKLCQ